MEHKLMTLKEIAQVSVKAIELKQSGKVEEGRALYRTIPLSPHMAMFVKKYWGKDILLQLGWNLAGAEKEFGQDWLNQ